MKKFIISITILLIVLNVDATKLCSLNEVMRPSTIGINNNKIFVMDIDKIHIDNNGLIYVFVNDLSNSTGQEINIFSPTGKYLYKSFIKLPEGLEKRKAVEIKGGFLYAYVEDIEGEQSFIKYEIEKPD